MQNVVFIGWGEPVRGRERRALDVFNEAMAYFGQLQQQGKIESFEPVLLEPHGGELLGFVLIHGEHAKLIEMLASPEFDRLVIRTRLIVDHYGVVLGTAGAELPNEFAVYEQQLAELA